MSTPQRPRSVRGTLRTVLLVAGVLATMSGSLGAQSPDTLHTPAARPRPVSDTVRLVNPTVALWHSFLVPGWGQALTGRHITGALFVTWEGVTMMMTLRAVQEAQYVSASGSQNVASKHQQIQDWVVLWVFNHLFAGAEAFVSAHLMDFPKDWKVEATPGLVRVRVPVPLGR